MIDTYLEMIENKVTKDNVRIILRDFFICVLSQKKNMDEFVVFDEKEKYEGDVNKLKSMHGQKIFKLLGKYDFSESFDEIIENEKNNLNRKSVIQRLEQSQRSGKKIQKVNVTEEDIRSISVRDIDYFISFLKKRYREKHGCDIELSSISQNLATIRAYFTYLIERDYLEKNPILKSFSKRYSNNQGKKKFKSLSLEEAKRLIGACDSPRLKSIVLTFLNTGVRVSELLDLKLKDIDYEGNIVHVIQGKGKKDRDAIMNDMCKRGIREWLLVRKYCSPKCDNVFVSQTGRRLSVPVLDEMVGQLGRKAGITINNSNGKRVRVHCHLLRHTFATLFMKNKGNLVTLQEQLGHTNLNTTRQYIDLSEEFKQQDYSKAMANLY